MKSKKQTDGEQLLMVAAAARILNRSAESVRAYERNGKLPAIKASNGHRLFRESDVRKLAAELNERAAS